MNAVPHPDQVKAGILVGKTLTFIKRLCLKEEIRAETLETRTIEFIRDHGGVPSLIGYEPPFVRSKTWKHAFCLSLNKEVVHGIPANKIVKPTDLIKADIVIKVGEWHADAARTFSANKRHQKIINDLAFTLDIMTQDLKANTPLIRPANILEQIARELGYYAVPELGGHGIGKIIHDDPFIPNVPESNDRVFEAQKSYAIEPVWATDECILELANDGWTYTADRLTAHMEDTYWFPEEGHAINLTKDKDDLFPIG